MGEKVVPTAILYKMHSILANEIFLNFACMCWYMLWMDGYGIRVIVQHTKVKNKYQAGEFEKRLL